VKKWACCNDHFIIKFGKNYEINGRFVTNLELQFKNKHGRMMEHKKKHNKKKKIKK